VQIDAHIIPLIQLCHYIFYFTRFETKKIRLFFVKKDKNFNNIDVVSCFGQLVFCFLAFGDSFDFEEVLLLAEVLVFSKIKIICKCLVKRNLVTKQTFILLVLFVSGIHFSEILFVHHFVLHNGTRIVLTNDAASCLLH
jgi:Kef-type K+ transport system membrane component KefB